MGKQLRLAALALVLALSLSFSAFAAAGTFADVDDSHWGYDAIERAFADGVVNGTSYDSETGVRTFEPAKTVTVAEFTAVMTRTFFMDAVEEAKHELPADAYWYAANMLAARNIGLFSGLEDAGENPTREMTRYEMAAMLKNIVFGMFDGKLLATPEQTVTDAVTAKIGDWDAVPEGYQTAVASTVSYGLLRGVDDKGSFAGENSLTRAEMAVIYTRVVEFASGLSEDDIPAEPINPDPANPVPVPAPVEPPTVDI